MALTDITLSLIAFKNLLGKSQTDNNKGLGNEAEGIFFNIPSNTIFMDNIDETPSIAISEGIVELISQADLISDPTSNGHAFFALYPTGHPLAGQRIKNAISPTFGFQYEIKVYDTGSNQISVNDPRDWIYQYNSGVFFQQDLVGLDPSKADLYVYTGTTLEEFAGTNGIITTNNGLTFNNNNISLGGLLIQNTVIDGNTGLYDFTIENINNLTLSNTSFSINMTNNTTVFTDSSTSGFGIIYNADYSANYINRSLVDKQYVDTQISNINTGLFTPNDKNLIANNTTVNGDLATNSAISLTPVDGSYVAVFVNGQEFDVGNGVKTNSCYFSVDGGTNARGFLSTHPNGQVQSGDFLYWNQTISGVNLISGWRISFLYLS